MRKLLTVLGVIILLFVGAFLFLLSKAGPDDAPSGEIIVDIETPRSQ